MKKSDYIAPSGTNIDAVKRQNARSGLSYNEVKQQLAETTGGHDTARYSDTDIQAVQQQNNRSEQGKTT